MRQEWDGRRSETSTIDNDALFRKVTRLCDVLNAEPGLQVLAVVGARWNVSAIKSRSHHAEIPFAPKTPAPEKPIDWLEEFAEEGEHLEATPPARNGVFNRPTDVT